MKNLFDGGFFLLAQHHWVLLFLSAQGILFFLEVHFIFFYFLDGLLDE